VIAAAVLLAAGAALAQAGPVLAMLGFDPAFASPLNFALLVYIVVFMRREIMTLRRASVAAAERLAETAKGSEDRATNAAAEITRLAGEISGTRQHVDHALVEIVVIGHAVRDKLAALKVENDLRGDPAPPPGPLVIPPASPESRH
jgi:hypothetical protein